MWYANLVGYRVKYDDGKQLAVGTVEEAEPCSQHTGKAVFRIRTDDGAHLVSTAPLSPFDFVSLRPGCAPQPGLCGLVD